VAVYDNRGSQSGDHTTRDAAGRDITNLGADANRVLELLRIQIDKDAQFRKLYTSALTKLGEQIRELAVRIQQREEDIPRLRNAITTGDSAVLNMTEARANAHKAAVAEQVAGQHLITDRRLTELEQGALAMILKRMEDDTTERRERQAVHDLTWRIVLWGMVFLFLMNCGLVILVVMVEVL
jgi:hypothetical protein